MLELSSGESGEVESVWWRLALCEGFCRVRCSFFRRFRRVFGCFWWVRKPKGSKGSFSLPRVKMLGKAGNLESSGALLYKQQDWDLIDVTNIVLSSSLLSTFFSFSFAGCGETCSSFSGSLLYLTSKQNPKKLVEKLKIPTLKRACLVFTHKTRRKKHQRSRLHPHHPADRGHLERWKRIRAYPFSW